MTGLEEYKGVGRYVKDPDLNSVVRMRFLLITNLSSDGTTRNERADQGYIYYWHFTTFIFNRQELCGMMKKKKNTEREKKMKTI